MTTKLTEGSDNRVTRALICFDNLTAFLWHCKAKAARKRSNLPDKSHQKFSPKARKMRKSRKFFHNKKIWLSSWFTRWYKIAWNFHFLQPSLIFLHECQNSLIAVFLCEIFWQLCAMGIRIGRWMRLWILGLEVKKTLQVKKDDDWATIGRKSLLDLWLILLWHCH